MLLKAYYVDVIYADFSKGFDKIDQNFIIINWLFMELKIPDSKF